MCRPFWVSGTKLRLAVVNTAASIMYFLFDFWYVTFDMIVDIIWIYKTCIPTHNRNSVFILREKWPISKHRQLEFGLEFERKGFNGLQIFSEGSSKPIRDDQVIRVPEGGLFSELNI